jgi:hypothetical protein
MMGWPDRPLLGLVVLSTHVVEPVQAPPALADQPRGERTRPVAGDIDDERTGLGLDRLRSRAIASVRALDRAGSDNTFQGQSFSLVMSSSRALKNWVYLIWWDVNIPLDGRFRSYSIPNRVAGIALDVWWSM